VSPPYGCKYLGYGIFEKKILVPHASVLAVDYVESRVLRQNLLNLEKLGVREQLSDGIDMFDFGFRASVDWKKRNVCTAFLILDQSMSFLALVNKITKGRIREVCCQSPIFQNAVRLISDYKESCKN
jgi:hypothetical protein